MPIVEVPGQGEVEFPDDMSDDQIAAVIRQSMPQQPSRSSGVGDTLKQLGKGALSGAADIGNTLINASSFIPRQLSPELEALNQRRQAGLKSFNQENAGIPFDIGRIGANIAGTAGAGNVLGMAARGLSASPRAAQIAKALESGGFNSGGGGMGMRVGAGAATGAASTGLVSPEDIGTGALVGGALPPAVRGAYSAGKGAVSGVKSMIEPFYKAGREQIIGRALRGVAGNQADEAMKALEAAQPLVQGSQPTAGMVAQNPGIAALERSAIANNPVATNELALRQAANNEARMAALQGITPNREAAQGARTAATQALYEQSSQAPVRMNQELVTLMQRPSMQAAVTRASKLAEESGEALDLNNLTGRSAQYIKMALDDMANSAPMSGIGGNELRSIQSTRQAYLDQLGKQIPEYLEANKQYAALSAPLSQADVLESVMQKGANFRGDLTPAAYARALSDRTAQTATGRPSATLEQVLTPEQLDVLGNVRQDLLNQDFAQTAGRGVGSNTVQNLAYSNMADQFGIPTGLQNFAPASALGNIAARAGNVAYKSANERIAAELAEALLDPRRAGQAMELARTNPRIANLVNALGAGASRGVPALASQR